VIGNLPRRLLAEAIGTMLLIIFGPGSVVAAVFTDGKADYASIGFISLSFGLVVALVIYAFGGTSGAHINPAVTIALATARRFAWADVPFYIVAQLAGAAVGGVLIVAIVGTRATRLGRVGLTALAPGVNYGQGMLAEAIGTFLLLLAIMALAVDRRAPAGWAGLMIGLAVACEIFVIGPLTGGAVNPARTFGPYVANSLFGGSTPWSEFVVYIVGPIVGAAAGVVVYDLLVQPADEARVGAGPGPAGETAGDGLHATSAEPPPGRPEPEGPRLPGPPNQGG